jgi:hypothetical protein
MLSVTNRPFMLSVFMLNVIMLSGIMLNVVVPIFDTEPRPTQLSLDPSNVNKTQIREH